MLVQVRLLVVPLRIQGVLVAIESVGEEGEGRLESVLSVGFRTTTID